MRTRVTTAAAGVVAVLLIAGLLLVYELVSSADTPTSEGTTVELLQGYDSAFVEAWVRGCIGSGESAAFCRCAIDEYTNRLRPDEFETASAVSISGGGLSELPENVRAAVEAVERECR